MQNALHHYATDNDLLVTAEVARLLRVHVESARRIIREKRLSAIKVGRRWRVSRAELNRVIDKGGI